MGLKGSNLYRVITFLLFSAPFFLSSSVQIKTDSEAEKLESNVLNQGLMALSNSKLQLNEMLNDELRKYRRATEIISIINQRNTKNEHQVSQLEEDVINLKLKKEEALKQYRSILLAEYKHNDYEQKLFYLASSENLKDLFTRSKHLKKIKKLRKQQLESIEQQEAIISDKLLIYNGKDEEVNELLKEKLKEVSLTVNKIRSLKEQLLVLNQEADNLKLNIQEFKEDRNDFEMGRNNQFSWPVSSGLLVTSFGKQHHAVEHGVIIQNKGVDILCHSSENVKTISMGVVKSITHLPNYGRTILVSHNEFIAVYAGLEDVDVQVGDFVYPGTTLGTIHQNRDGQHKLHFELWQDNQPVNPSSYIKASLQ